MNEEEKAVVLSWKKHINGEFVLMKVYRDYAVLQSSKTEQQYGIKALTDGFDTMLLPYKAPALITTTLVPYKGVIVWDGLVAVMSIRIGNTMARLFADECDKARAEGKIITSL